MTSPRACHPCLPVLVVAAWVALALPALAAEATPSRAGLGERVGAATLRGDDGKEYTFHDLQGSKALVVVLLSFDCPVSTGYAPVLAELAGAYADRGVAFLGIASDPDEDAASLARRAREFRLPFRVLADPRRSAAAALRAETTPETFLLDRELVLRYRGRIDDRYAARLRPKARVGRQDLREALDELLAGRAVTEPATRAVGCPLRPDAVKATGPVTYHRDVLPILQENCQECHRPGEIGPFSLMTYRQAVRWAGDIKTYAQTRQMPPWKPVEGPAFHNERRLSDRAIATLAAWADGGTPEGDARDAPPPRQFTDGWQLGTPDLVLTPGEDFHLGAGGPDVYRCFPLPTGLTEDRWVNAVEVRPGNRRMAHHALLFIDRRGAARRLERAGHEAPGSATAEDRGPGYSVGLGYAFLPGFLPGGGLGGWAPGQVAHRLPAGTAFALPRGADVVLQLHYHRSGRPETDRTAVGLYFARGPSRRVQGVVVPGALALVPAGAERFRVRGSTWVRQDCQLHAVMPHMHLLGREIRLTMTPPGGTARTLVAIKDWDFDWQETYFLRETIPIKAGTRFDIEGVYDNSAGNARNPNQPPRTVCFGMATGDEMCVGFLAVSAAQPWPIFYDVRLVFPGLEKLGGLSLPGMGL
jgi:peroxiredoxin